MKHKQLGSRTKTILKLLTALTTQHPSLQEPVADVMEEVGLEMNKGARAAPQPKNAARRQPTSARKPQSGGAQGVILPPVTPSRGAAPAALGVARKNSPAGISRTPIRAGSTSAGGRRNSQPDRPNSRPTSSKTGPGLPSPRAPSGKSNLSLIL